MSDPGPAWAKKKPVGIPDILMFILELSLWGSCFWVGWRTGNGIGRWLFAAVFGVGAILLWVVFRPPGMMGQGKRGVIPTPGPVRLVIEIGLFLLAGIGLWHTGYRWAAETLWTFAALIYILSYSRIRWLLEH